MHIGMLWYSGESSEPLKTRIEKAVDYYRRKYHQEPNLCLVHPSMLKEGTLPKIEKMEVRTYGPVLPGHMWIGIETKA